MNKCNLVFLFIFSLFSCSSVYQVGKASWYGPGFQGKKTASGQIFNMNAMTAAHKDLPFGTQVKVTSKKTGKSVIVKINDRGPFISGRIIDLSKKAAQILGILHKGEEEVSLVIIE
ncbi:MAG: septal ring lytic transglycosylase RlpA family protein [Halobacteriovoraceae bacterium]|nr:septal ring lytic transglycosylase RlpA family protein [Halobacteriovoraceae bacterium]MCB9095540.1 septal ring lytic transglycosylase RlpA family protein [Halobacteriovoraceae bacterium]